MNHIDEFNLPYLRVYGRMIKILKDSNLPNLRKIGSTMPVIIRQDALIRFPRGLQSSYDFLAWLLLLEVYFKDSDYQIGLQVNQILVQASNYHYEGKWRIWWNLAECFQLRFIRESREVARIQQERSSSVPKISRDQFRNSERDGVDPFLLDINMFSFYNFIEFLLTQMSEDDLFGNLIRRACQLARLLKVETYAERQKRIEARPVRRKVYHRGYNDHGHLPDPQERVWRECNREENPPPKEPRHDTMNNVVTWGQDSCHT